MNHRDQYALMLAERGDFARAMACYSSSENELIPPEVAQSIIDHHRQSFPLYGRRLEQAISQLFRIDTDDALDLVRDYAIPYLLERGNHLVKYLQREDLRTAYLTELQTIIDAHDSDSMGFDEYHALARAGLLNDDRLLPMIDSLFATYQESMATLLTVKNHAIAACIFALQEMTTPAAEALADVWLPQVEARITAALADIQLFEAVTPQQLNPVVLVHETVIDHFFEYLNRQKIFVGKSQIDRLIHLMVSSNHGNTTSLMPRLFAYVQQQNNPHLNAILMRALYGNSDDTVDNFTVNMAQQRPVTEMTTAALTHLQRVQYLSYPLARQLMTDIDATLACHTEGHSSFLLHALTYLTHFHDREIEGFVLLRSEQAKDFIESYHRLKLVGDLAPRNDAAFEYLVSQLDHPDRSTQADICRTLAQVGQRSIPIIQTFLRARPLTVRRFEHTINGHAYEQLIPDLLALIIRDDITDTITTSAITGSVRNILKNIGTETAYEALIQITRLSDAMP